MDAFRLDSAVSEVMTGNIVVIEGLFSERLASEAVHSALGFASRVPVFDTKDGSASPRPDENFHRIDNNPERSKTKHIFHTFNFESLPEVDSAPIGKIFEILLSVDNRISARRGSLTRVNGTNFHPQIIHYPRGGGFFDRHTHPLEPQKIGLIATLTKKGEHFNKGGTLFWNDGKELDAEPAQTIGSVTLFRFDLPHAVSKVDPSAPLEFGKPTGRWVAVLPYR